MHRSRKTILLLLTSLLCLASRHPYYVSICQIDHNPKTKSLEITFKIFTDDLEYAIETSTGEKLRLGSKRENKHAGKILFNYVKENVSFKIDGKKHRFDYVGYEVEQDLTYIYVEIPHVAEMHQITVKNPLLTNVFENQSNIVHINYHKEQKSLLLNAHKKEDSAKFE